MQLKATEIGDGGHLETDICVAGAGPAGIAVALELAANGMRVVLLERGATDLEGEVEGPYPPLQTTRCGGFGGTVPLWDAELAPGVFGARLGELSPHDLDAGAGWTGWPIGRDELRHWCVRAAEICGVAPTSRASVDAHGSLVDHVLGYSPAAVFLDVHRQTLLESPVVQVVEPAEALELRFDDDGSAVGLEVSGGHGRSFMVHARAFVLALGGIENARFLLLNELGNENDCVGRFFMDHPTALAELNAEPRARLGKYDVRFEPDSVTVRTLGLGDEARAEHQLGNSGMFFVPAPGRDARAVEAASSLLGRLRGRGRGTGTTVEAITNLFKAPDAVVLETYRRLARRFTAIRAFGRVSPRARLLNTLGVGPTAGWSQLRGGAPTRFDVHHVFEQFPERERRIVLGDVRDTLGRRLPQLRFFISDAEVASLERTQEVIKAELDRFGIGTLVTTRELAGEGDVRDLIHPTAHHHLGTTRMATSPEHGVVDADGRLHAARNVYIAGGSVFPTSGYVNPTLTIVALASRLGVHLADRWRAS